MELFFVIVFALNPVFCILAYLFFGPKDVRLTKKKFYIKLSNKKLLFFSFICIIFVSLVNATKLAASDLIVYYDSYARAYHEDFFTYWATSAKWGTGFDEPGYVLYSWVLSNITNANTAVLMFVLSFFSYLFFCLGIINWGRYFNLPVLTIFVAIIIACFYPYIFTRSAHLLRQFVSMCLLFYATSKIPITDSILQYIKKTWIVLLIMVLFHKSSILLISFLVFPLFRKSIYTHKLMYLGVMGALVVYRFIAAVLSPYFGNSLMGSAVEQVNRNVSVQLEGLTIVEYLTLAIFMIVFGGLLLKRKLDVKLLQVSNVVVVLVLFVIVNINQPSIGRRFFYYLLVFLPLLWFILDSYYKINPIVQLLLSLIIIIGFAYYIDNGPWEYNVNGNVLFTSPFYYDYNTTGR